MQEAELKIRLEVLGGDNLNNLKKVKRELDSAFGAVTRGTPEQQKIADGLKFIREEISKTGQLAETTNAKTIRSYFQLGQQLRSAQMASVNFSRVMQDIPFGLMAIQNNIEPLVMSLQSLKQEASAAGVSFGGAITRAALSVGGLVGVVSVLMPMISRLSDYFGKLEERAGAAAERIMQARIASGDISAAENTNMLFRKMQEKQGALSAAKTETNWQEKVAGIGAFVPWVGGAITSITGGPSGAAESARVRVAEAQAAFDEARAAWLNSARSLMGNVKPIDWLSQQIGALPGERGGAAGGGGGDFFRSEMYNSIRGIRQGAPGIKGMGGRFAPAGPGGGVRGPGMIQPNIQAGLVADWSVLTNQMGHTLTSALTQGFMEGFQNGTNLLKSFSQAVLSALMGIVAQQASIGIVSGLLSLIPGVGTFGAISGALGGIFSSLGSSGGAVPVAGGQEGVNGTLKGIQNAVESLELRVDNVGLYMGVSRGKLLKEAR